MLPPINVPPTFRIIAHRGASAYAPENSLAAFNLAYEMGASEFELDVQLSVDGRVVLCHDTTLDRYGHRGRVEEITWADLEALDMGAWFSPFLFAGEPLITLDDLFRRFRANVTYHIELKGTAARLPEAVDRLIVHHGLESCCIITSFNVEALAAMQGLAPGLRRGWLVDRVEETLLERAASLHLFQICPRATALNRRAVIEAHRMVPEVRAWGVGGQGPEIINLVRHLVDIGCDGATVNWPDWFRHVAD